MMTRKRAVKLLMARGHGRNLANRFMRHKRDGTSNLSMVSNLCRVYGVGPGEIFNPWPPKSAMSIETMMRI